MRISALSSLLLSIIVGCAPSPSPTPVPTTPSLGPIAPPTPDLPGPPTTVARPPLILQPTHDLVSDPETRRLVDALASETRMESSHIGVAGAPSAIWAKWDAVAKRATPAEIVALTRHEKPVVRAYAAEHVISKLPAEAGALLPLLGDQTTVATQEGCMGGDSSLASIVIEGLSHAAQRSRAGEDVLLAAAADPALGNMSAQALAWVARARPEDAEAQMRFILTRAPEARKLEVLRAVGTLTPSGLCPELATLAMSPDAAMRQAAAHALGACRDAKSLGVIEALLADPARGVATAAAQNYLKHPGHDAAKVEAMLADDDPTQAKAYAWSLASSEDPRALALVEKHLLRHPDDARVFDVLQARADRSEVIAMLRRFAAATTPSHGQSPDARSEAVAMLAGLRDPADLAEMRRSLRSWNSDELDAAFAAVVALHDTLAIPVLEQMAAETNPIAKRRAEDALSKLRP